jgi:hypothetical protein
MTLACNGNTVKGRTVGKDVFYTPRGLSLSQIQRVPARETDLWLDPFRGLGSYYDQFPTENKDWCEITDGRDFFEYDGPVDVICSNPPYSILNAVFEKCVSLKPRVISFLIGQCNLTPKRIELMQTHGYALSGLHICKIQNWFGNSFVVMFEKDGVNCATFDRMTWR